MSTADDISQFLNLESEILKPEIGMDNIFGTKFRGRWDDEEWEIYVEFALRQVFISKSGGEYFNSFSQKRRGYISFDRRYVEFLKEHYNLGPISDSEYQRLIRRTKSKYSTLRRKHGNPTSKKTRHNSQPYDFIELMYQEAKKILQQKQKQNLRKLTLQYQMLREGKCLSKHFEMSLVCEIGSEQIISTIKTRSNATKRNFNGNPQFS